jgi:hypothetical protein
MQMRNLGLVTLLAVPLTASSSLDPPLFPSIVTDVPGRAPSAHYGAQVLFGGAWTDVYVFETTAKASIASPHNGYFPHLEGWTQSWVSSQLPPGGAPLRLRVRRLGGAPIAAAAAHPASSGVVVANVSAAGVAELVAPRAARAVVDFDGAMDENDTGPDYSGPPVHAFAWFVDDAPAPGLLPDPSAPTTHVVWPGDAWPAPAELAPAAWPTVIFAPGVHRAAPPWVTDAPRAWAVYNLSAQARYYLCPGAVVHAAFHGGVGAWAQNGLAVDGPGVLSGEEMVRADDPDNDSPSCLVFSGVRNSSVRGITMIDCPNHHLILGQAAGDELSNVKVLGWRTNGDGVHVFDSWRVRDLFLRTQDDALYVSCGDGCAATFDRITTWNDANGVAFLFSPGAGVSMAGTVLRDSDVIYTRTSWYWWGPNTVFVNRGPDASGHAMSGAAVENVRVEDRFPAFNPFRLEVLPPAVGAAFCNISFTNISVANFSTIRSNPLVHPPLPLPHGIPNTIYAVAPSEIYNVAFNNVSIAGIAMRTLVRDPTIFNLSVGLVNVTVDGVDINTLRAGRI